MRVFRTYKTLIMNIFFQNLMNELNKQIKKPKNSFDLNLEQIKQNKLIFVESLENLDTFSKTYSFGSEQEEINYYKNLKPQIISQIIYYFRKAKIIGRIPLGTLEAKQDHFKNELNKIEVFFQNNIQSISNYRANETLNDKQLYLTKNLNLNLLPAHLLISTNDINKTNGGFFIAELLANQKLQNFLFFQLYNIDKSVKTVNNVKTPNLGVFWTASKTALIEMIYGIFTQGAVNNGNVDILHLVNIFSEIFNIEIKEPYHTFSGIKQRKKNQTAFIDSMKSSILEYIEKQDEA